MGDSATNPSGTRARISGVSSVLPLVRPTYKRLPQTRGRTLEEIDADLNGGTTARQPPVGSDPG